MLRPKRPNWFVLVPVLLVAAFVVASCGGGEEYPILQKFFTASKLHDNVTLGNFAAVSFDPAKDGVMGSFSITNQGAEQSKTLVFKERAKMVKEAADADNALSKRKMEYQDNNTEAIDRVVKIEAKGGKATGKDGVIQHEWTKWRDEQSLSSKKLSEARKTLNEGRGVVELSLLDPRNPVDITVMGGVLVSKDITIEGSVKAPSGASEKRTYVFTLQQARMKKADGTDLNGRWIITGYKEAK
jgi:hypothetical protein